MFSFCRVKKNKNRKGSNVRVVIHEEAGVSLSFLTDVETELAQQKGELLLGHLTKGDP